MTQSSNSFPLELRNQINCLIGSIDNFESAPVEVFDQARIDLIAEWSARLLAYQDARKYPDIITFAFWCRRAHQQRFAEKFKDGQIRIGLGQIFHIAPSNVPVNFAYSLVFAFLTGNSSALRLSEQSSPQEDILLDTLGQILTEKPFSSQIRAFLVMRYKHNDCISSYWLQNTDGRLIWGGNATVNAMRSLGAHPRSREIAFVDRYSLAAINADALLKSDEKSIASLCEALYNDVYLMGQRACSSPQLLIWVGDYDIIAAAQKKLWPHFADVVHSRNVLTGTQAMDKYVFLCNEILEFENIGSVHRTGNRLYNITLTHLSSRQKDQRGADGVIHEISLNNLKGFLPLVDSSVQTLTYFGFSVMELQNFVLDNRINGIDRIVPIGKALDMGWVWDGYDIIGNLSRIIVIS